MKLDEFIHASVAGIMRGIRGAQEEALREGGMICPKTAAYEAIEFDVAVSTKLKAGASVDASGDVYVLTGDFGLQGEASKSTVNRLRFGVRVSSPTPPVAGKSADEIGDAGTGEWLLRST